MTATTWDPNNKSASITLGAYATITSSSDYNGSSLGLLIDNNINNFWASTGSDAAPWVLIQLGVANSLDHTTFIARNDGYFSQSPSSVAVTGSNDNITWTDVGDLTFAPWTAAAQAQTINLTTGGTAYLYYKFTFGASGGPGGNTALAELQLFDAPDTQVLLGNNGNDLIATASSLGIALSTRFITSNLSHFEVNYTVMTGVDSVGFLCYGGNGGILLGTDNYGVGYESTGQVKLNNVVLATIAPYAAGAIVGVAINVLKRLIWFTLDGVTWNDDIIANQNPATSTGGISFATINWCSPRAALSLAANGDRAITAFSVGSFAYTPPAGFNSIDSCGVTLVDGSQHGTSFATESLYIPPGAAGSGVPYTEASAAFFMPAGPIKGFSGTVTENSVPVAKTVRAYDTDTGELIGSTISDPGTGYYAIPTPGHTAVDLVFKDSPAYQAQIFDNLTPG